MSFENTKRGQKKSKGFLGLFGGGSDDSNKDNLSEEELEQLEIYDFGEVSKKELSFIEKVK